MENKIKAFIMATLAAGQGQSTFMCPPEKSPEEVNRLNKLLKSSENWQVYGETVWNAHGISFNGIASWGPYISAQLNHYEYRYRLLRIDRFGTRLVFAIPITAVDSLSTLPGIDLRKDELALIWQMADELTQQAAVPELFLSIDHPAKPTLKNQRKQWEDTPLDATALLNLLEDLPALLSLMTAALAAQYRSFLDGRCVPEGIFNFVLPKKNEGTDLWLDSVLQALTFTNEPGKTAAGPISITLKEAADLHRWDSCYERLAVIHTSTGVLLWPRLEDLEERDRILKSGGRLLSAIPTTPICLTRSVLHHPQAADITLPAAPPKLTCLHQDLLRTAMSKLLRRKHAEAALQRWEEQMRGPAAYRLNGFTLWQEILLEYALTALFPEPAYQNVVDRLCSDSQQRREEQERAIEEKLQRGLAFLTDPQKYAGQIIDRPNSRGEWNSAVNENMLAFRFIPIQGEDKGRTFLAFTPDTVKELLRRARVGEELYDAFLTRCNRQGILNNKKRPINLGGNTLNAVVFDEEKF